MICALAQTHAHQGPACVDLIPRVRCPLISGTIVLRLMDMPSIPGSIHSFSRVGWLAAWMGLASVCLERPEGSVPHCLHPILVPFSSRRE